MVVMMAYRLDVIRSSKSQGHILACSLLIPTYILARLPKHVCKTYVVSLTYRDLNAHPAELSVG